MKKVAVIEGGYSNEKVVSIKSAKTVYDNGIRLQKIKSGKGGREPKARATPLMAAAVKL